MRTRDEHLTWCKQRALEYESPADAWGSFVSDMGKHEGTRQHPALTLGHLTERTEGFPYVLVFVGVHATGHVPHEGVYDHQPCLCVFDQCFKRSDVVCA